MLTEPSFINMIHVLDKRARSGKNYGFRQTIWAEIVEELEYLNDIAAYIEHTYPGTLEEAETAYMKAQESDKRSI